MQVGDEALGEVAVLAGDAQLDAALTCARHVLQRLHPGGLDPDLYPQPACAQPAFRQRDGNEVVEGDFDLLNAGLDGAEYAVLDFKLQPQPVPFIV